MNEVDIVEIYRRRRKWRWRYKDGANHQIMADGAEGYNTFSAVWNGASHVLGLVEAPVPRMAHQRVSRQGGWPDVLVVVSR